GHKNEEERGGSRCDDQQHDQGITERVHAALTHWGSNELQRGCGYPRQALRCSMPKATLTLSVSDGISRRIDPLGATSRPPSASSLAEVAAAPSDRRSPAVANDRGARPVNAEEPGRCLDP